MSDLTDFLLARIAEDEAVAKVEIAEEKQVGGSRHGQWSAVSRGELQFAGGAVAAVPDPMLAHIARHDPARVLAECEAKRRIVERHGDCGKGYGYCDDGGHGWYAEDGGPVGCSDLADLAVIWVEHPDYRSEWRP